MKNMDIEYRKLLHSYRNARKHKCCYANSLSECSGKIILAHSISRSKTLGEISKNGLVSRIEAPTGSMNFGFEDVEISRASTFTGFCAKHDEMLFKDIDENPFIFNQNTIRQYHLRTIAHELYKKESNSKGMNSLIEEYSSNTRIDSDLIGDCDEYTKITIRDFKNELKESLNYDFGLKFRIFTFDRFEIPHVSSSLFVINNDYFGNKLFDFDDFNSYAPLISINSIRYKRRQFVLFVWRLDNDDICKQWLDSFIDGIKTGQRLFSLIIDVSENLYFDRDWIAGIRATDRKNLIEAYKMVLINDIDYPFYQVSDQLSLKGFSSYPEITGA